MAERYGPRPQRGPRPAADTLAAGADKLVSYEQAMGLIRAFNEGISKGAIQRVLRPLRSQLVQHIREGRIAAYSVDGRVPDILADKDKLATPMGFDMPGVYLRAHVIAQYAEFVGLSRLAADGSLPGGQGLVIAFGRALRAAHDYAAEIGDKLKCFNRNGMGQAGGGDKVAPERLDFIDRETQLRPCAPLFHYPT